MKSHFWYNKRQRNGVFFLLLFIVILQVLYVYVDFSENDPKIDSTEIAFFEKKLDSLYVTKLRNEQPKIYPFNPSFISDFKGSQLGLSIDEIDRLLEHQAQGKYINSVEEFQDVSKISDSLLGVISPYFKFPDWISEKDTKKEIQVISHKDVVVSKIYVKKDLNTVTSDSLIKVYGIGKTLAERIVKYRASLNGFLMDEQINEVYGLKNEVIDEILKKYTVISKPEIKKLNVNTASFKEVLHLPYIDYDLTKRIFNYRDEVAEIQSLEELKNIEGFPLDLFDRIAVYLDAK